jgi:hypothetical protein
MGERRERAAPGSFIKRVPAPEGRQTRAPLFSVAPPGLEILFVAIQRLRARSLALAPGYLLPRLRRLMQFWLNMDFRRKGKGESRERLTFCVVADGID